MKKIFITLIFGILFTGLTVNLNAQTGVDAKAYAELVEALTVVKDLDLRFGRFVPGTGTGTIKIDATGTLGLSTTGDVTTIPGGDPQAAKFTISGLAGNVVLVSVPSSTVKLAHENATDELDITTFAASQDNLTLPGGGEATVFIGGTLDIPAAGAGLAKGIYTGNFTVTFQYQ